LWSSDSGAYLFGSWLGKHRLFPRISPKKSWEGSIGGGLTALAASQIVATFVPFAESLTPMLSRLLWAGLALLTVLVGTWGDLVESLFKRKLGIKDSGNILPGHGGMLDRFDSSLLAIPAAVIYIYTVMLNIIH
jgi:phosphatidate cytidylyltransferase